MFVCIFFFFFFKQKTAYEIGVRLVGSEMCIRDRCWSRSWTLCSTTTPMPTVPDGGLWMRSRCAGNGASRTTGLSTSISRSSLTPGPAWMAREFRAVPFERYSDDIVVHCVSERQARYVQVAIARRLAEVGLELHPDKTRLVYCKDSKRRGTYENTSFTFLGYTFRPRKAFNKKTAEAFTGFLPGSAGPS